MKKTLIITDPSEPIRQFRSSAKGDEQFLQQLQGFSLTTADITYFLPDAPHLVQTYLWQDYDLAPKFPKLKNFLDWWQENLDGKVKEVRVAHSSLIKPAELKMLDAQYTIN